jgi:hypothetical protein
MSDTCGLQRCNREPGKQTRNANGKRKSERTPTPNKGERHPTDRERYNCPNVRLAIRGKITCDTGTERDRHPGYQPPGHHLRQQPFRQ